jgi:hypothetical protein
MSDGQELNISLEDYLAISAVSSGGVEDFSERPALYNAKHVTKTVREECTPAMLLGSAIHCLVLEGREEFDNRYSVGPCDDKRTKKWKDWAETRHGALLTASQGEVIEACREAISLHEAACNLLFTWPGDPEVSGTWNDDETGLLCKYRLDRNLRDRLTIAELKTSRSALPEDVARAAVANGYHVRGAWYVDGFRQVYGETPNAMVFVTVDTELDPSILEDRVYVWTLEPQLEELGARKVRSALDGIAACRASGVWRADWSSDVHTVATPRWMAAQL